jgi:tRNA (uracil-5-)-methyltransferase
MFDPAEPRTPVPINDFAPAIRPIRSLMPVLKAKLRGNLLLRRKLFQLEFMASTLGEVLVTLIYHRALDDEWEIEATKLARELGVSIVGRSRKQKRVIGRDFIVDSVEVAGQDYHYRQYEQSFVQPNAPVNAQMLAWAVEQSQGSANSPKNTGDLLELYCGNGNFTLPLSRCFRRVLATELSKSGTRAALENLQANNIDNVSVVRLSAEEVSQAIVGVRPFRRLAALPVPLAEHDLRTVFVDPPRAGLDAATLDCVRGFEQILYISCNPKTLRENLEALAATHDIESMAFFDQFPYAAHLESGVLLRRR